MIITIFINHNLFFNGLHWLAKPLTGNHFETWILMLFCCNNFEFITILIILCLIHLISDFMAISLKKKIIFYENWMYFWKLKSKTKNEMNKWKWNPFEVNWLCFYCFEFEDEKEVFVTVRLFNFCCLTFKVNRKLIECYNSVLCDAE